jgi:hypothetical protein
VRVLVRDVDNNSSPTVSILDPATTTDGLLLLREYPSLNLLVVILYLQILSKVDISLG